MKPAETGYSYTELEDSKGQKPATEVLEGGWQMMGYLKMMIVNKC